MLTGTAMNKSKKTDPDPDLDRHQNRKFDPDPDWHQNDADLQQWF
jgi:hypothetical protein